MWEELARAQPRAPQLLEPDIGGRRLRSLIATHPSAVPRAPMKTERSHNIRVDQRLIHPLSRKANTIIDDSAIEIPAQFL